jgi:hypothetical protein
MDERYQGNDISYSTYKKIDTLCSQNCRNFNSYFKKFLALQDDSIYGEDMLKQRFVSGLPADDVNVMVQRLEERKESLYDLQNYVSRYRDRKAGITNHVHNNGASSNYNTQSNRGASSGPSPMDLDQVDVEALICRPFRPLNDAH